MIFSERHLRKMVNCGILSADEYATILATGDNLFDALLSIEDIDVSKIISFITENIPSIKRYRLSDIDTKEIISSSKVINKKFCKKYRCFPLSKISGGELPIAMVNPFNQGYVSDITFALDAAALSLYICTHEQMDNLISAAFEIGVELFDVSTYEEGDEEEDTGIINLDEELAQSNDSAVISMVNAILAKSISTGVSDIHIEGGDETSRIRVRVDGDLRVMQTFPSGMHHTAMSRIKIMSNLDISNTRSPQDGRINLILNGRTVDLRVSILPTAKGEKCVMRILDKSGLSVDLNKMGLSKRDMNISLNAVGRKEGACLVTGPTGSGKTTTLYSFLNYVNDPAKNIITVEDPVEFMLEGINQVSVNPKRGLTFAGALRSILRQDPDIIMLGEIRDGETAGIALEAAQTGHMVLSTLHTNDAASVVTRLHELGLDRTLISASLNAIIAQRLIKRLCPVCSVEGHPSKLQHETIGIPLDYKIKKAVGCDKCNRGYKGRMGIHEVIRMTDSIKDLINEGGTHAEIVKHSRNEGMLTIFENGLNAVLYGITSLDELLGTAIPSDDFVFTERVRDRKVVPLDEMG